MDSGHGEFTYLVLEVGAADMDAAHLLHDTMPFVASMLDYVPAVRHAGVVEVMVQVLEVGVQEPPLIVRRLDAQPTGLGALVRTGEGVDADRFSSLGETLVLP